MMNKRTCLALLGLATSFLFLPNALAQDAPSKEQLDFFESKIRPVLVRECYSCHSAEAASSGKLRGQLLLDTREGTLKGGETGPALVPGKPEESLMLAALKHESIEMPPKGKLSTDTIADFERWILHGAADPRNAASVPTRTAMDFQSRKGFWSFVSLENHEVPSPNNDTPWARWAHTTIDRFLLAAQLQKGLEPNPIADARTLIRRAWFDLIGLPPTPEEMRGWISRLESKSEANLETVSPANQSAHQINRQQWSMLIDHLLESPHYGERQARHWMDVARFAESHGYEQDYDRPNAYHYRDFLIRAFNSDLPYDQFVQWQIAGDQVAPENPLAWMATGFLVAGAFPTQLTETEFESARYDELDDMVATTGVAFLGLSVGCARCHDHKFDPIPTADYYKMAACFTKAIRTEKKFDLQPEENAKRREQYAIRLEAATQALRDYETNDLPATFAKWLNTSDLNAQSQATWQTLVGEIQSTAGTKYRQLEDHSYLATGEPPAKEVVTLTAKIQNANINAIRIEALTHDSLPGKGPGRAPNGNFALGNLRLRWIAGDSKLDGDKPFKDAKATHQQNSDSLSVKASIDKDPVSGWAVDGQIGKDQAAVFYLDQPLSINEEATLELKLDFNHPNPRHAMGRMRFSVSANPIVEPSVGDVGPPQSVQLAFQELRAAAKAGSASQPNEFIAKFHDQWMAGIAYYRKSDARWMELSKAIADLKASGSGEELATVMVTSEGLPHLKHHADDRGFPHFYPVTYQLRRGDVGQKVQEALPGVLQVLSSAQSTQSFAGTPSTPSRMMLAQWITDTRAGAGNLAARVMVNRLWQHHFGRGLVATPNDFGASGTLPTHLELLDHLAKQFVDSGWKVKSIHRAIMNSSAYMQASTKLADDPRARIDVDNHLLWRRIPLRLEAEAIRDSLLAISGQLDKTMYGPGTLDPSMRRRSIYFFIKRSQLIPTMMLFDWPEHLVSIGQRSTTTIAPQALMFMNNPEGRGYADALSKRIDSTDPAKAIEQAYQWALGRGPNELEFQLSMDFLKSQRMLRIAAGEANAESLAMVDLCQAILSMNELIFVD